MELRFVIAKFIYYLHEPHVTQPILLNEGPADYESANACMPPRPNRSLVLIATCSSLDNVHERLHRPRWDWTTRLDPVAVWTRGARKRYLAWALSEEALSDEALSDEALDVLGGDASHGLGAAELSMAVARYALGDAPSLAEAIQTERSHVKVDDALSMSVGRKVRFDDVAGLAQAKKAIQRAVVWPATRYEAMERLGLEAPSGVLLHGPPGVGKTMLVRAAATEADATLFELTPANVVSSKMGESEKVVGNVFRTAMARAPALVFIDEFDTLFPKRSSSDGKVGSSLVTTLCVCFDDLGAWKRDRAEAAKQAVEDGDDAGDKRGLGVVVLAACNRPNAVDPALLQYGRFDYEIQVPLPDEADRLALVTNLVRPDEVDDPELLAETARKTDGFSGADLSHLVACAFDHAALRNSKTLSRADFDAAEAEASTLAQDLEDERQTKARNAAAAEKRGKLPDYPRVLATKTYGDYDDVPDT